MQKIICELFMRQFCKHDFLLRKQHDFVVIDKQGLEVFFKLASEWYYYQNSFQSFQQLTRISPSSKSQIL